VDTPNLDRVLALNAQGTSEAKASTPRLLGPNPLWKHKGMKLPDYIEHVASHFIAGKSSESEAIAKAIGIVRDWSEGKTPNGKGKPDPDTKAAAVKAMAEWEADKAQVKASALSIVLSASGDMICPLCLQGEVKK
jgi:hypothetical protein